MEPRLTRGEYWILSAAVVDRMPLGRLTVSNIEEAFNRPSHGLDVESVTRTVRHLLQERLVCAGMYARTHAASVWTEVALDTEGVEAAVRERVVRDGPYYRTLYGLTEKGAAAWEAFARPDWSLFVKHWGEARSFSSTILCQSERALREYVVAFDAWLGVEPGTLVFDQVESWEATYRKSLRVGHRARFVGRDWTKPTVCRRPDRKPGSAVSWMQQRWCNRWL